MFYGNSLDCMSNDHRVEDNVFQPQSVQQLLHPASQISHWTALMADSQHKMNSYQLINNNNNNKKHLKNVGPIRYFEPPLHCQSPGVDSRTPAIAIAQAGVRCPRQQQQQQQQQRVTEGTAMAAWNGPNNNSNRNCFTAIIKDNYC